MKHKMRYLLFPLLLLLLAACGSDSAGPNSVPATTDVTLLLRTIPPGLKTNRDVVALTSARLVVRRIELLAAGGAVLNLPLERPLVQDLQTIAGDSILLRAGIAHGSYNGIRYTIGPLTVDDGPVFQEVPELRGQSCLASGFVTTAFTRPFEFSSSFGITGQRLFEQPLQLSTATATAEVILTIDMAEWFLDETGSFRDPADPDMRDEIENAINASIKLER